MPEPAPDNPAIYEANLRALRARFPDLAAGLETQPDDLTLIETQARSGAPSLKVIDPASGREIAYHSQADPLRAAGREAAGVNFESTRNWIVCGMGYGYHLLEILKKARGGYFLLAVERSWSVFRSALRRVDLTPLLDNEHVFLHVGGNINALSEWLFQTLGEMCVEDMELSKHAPSERLYFQFYNSIIPEVRRSVNRFEVNVLTAQAHGRKFQHNMLFNVLAALEAADAGNLYGKWKGKPAFIVAAGPSLDHNRHLLRHAAGRAMILSVDSSYPILLSSGVRPELVAVIDPIERKKRIFEEMPDHGHTHMLLIQHAHPQLPRAFGGPVFFSASSAPTAVWQEQVIGKFAFLGECLTVAHGAFFTALHMGANPIVFVGQDLAFSRELGQTHAGSGRHSWGASMNLEHQRRSMVNVQGVDGYPVPTFRNLAAFIKTFEVEIDKWKTAHPQTVFIDATEGGAFIQGTQPLTLAEVIDRYCTADLDPAGAVRAAFTPSRSPRRVERLKTLTEKTIEKTRRLITVCTRGLKAAQRMQRMLEKSSFPQDDYLRTAKRITDANREAFQDDVFIELVGQTLIRTKITVKRHDLIIKYEEDERRKQEVQAEKFVGVFEDFKGAAQWLLPELEALLTRIRQYQRATG